MNDHPSANAITPQVLEKLGPSLERYARRLAARRDEADDLLQETWYCALCGIDSFRGDASLLTWLRGIMRHRFADRLRKKKNFVELDEDTLEALDTCSAEAHLNIARNSEALGAALAQLSPVERKAVQLCDLDELERDQAAARLGVTRGHLRVILHRARRKLEQMLAAEELSLSRAA